MTPDETQESPALEADEIRFTREDAESIGDPAAAGTDAVGDPSAAPVEPRDQSPLERPEVQILGAFVGAFVLAKILRRLLGRD